MVLDCPGGGGCTVTLSGPWTTVTRVKKSTIHFISLHVNDKTYETQILVKYVSKKINVREHKLSSVRDCHQS